MCDAVWERYLGRVWAAGDGTEIIWNRQVNDFWEVTWTAGATDEPGGLLAVASSGGAIARPMSRATNAQ